MGSLPEVHIHLDQRLVDEITRLGWHRYPAEACGVLLPRPLHETLESAVVELPNRSPRFQDSYEILGADVKVALAGWIETATIEEQNAIAVWHTHPGGNPGPSRGDLRKRIKGATYLVVALDAESQQGVPCWF